MLLGKWPCGWPRQPTDPVPLCVVNVGGLSFSKVSLFFFRKWSYILFGMLPLLSWSRLDDDKWSDNHHWEEPNIKDQERQGCYSFRERLLRQAVNQIQALVISIGTLVHSTKSFNHNHCDIGVICDLPKGSYINYLNRTPVNSTIRADVVLDCWSLPFTCWRKSWWPPSWRSWSDC